MPLPATQKPILIIGAGISGLLLAQHLRKLGGPDKIPFRIFERDADLTTRGLGWGLTLHWSLPALRALLPEELLARLPEAYVDQKAVEEGRASRFPFFDLSTGELKASTPDLPESARIRVTRDRFRRLLATGLEIEWGKALISFQTLEDGSVQVQFNDGTTVEGRLLVACDGGSSRVRNALFPGVPKYQVPVRMMGVRIDCDPEEIDPIRKLDAFFLQGAASQNDSFVYCSILDAPGNINNTTGKYTCQICVSWPIRPGFFGSSEPIDFPTTSREGVALIKKFANTWAEPFRSLAQRIPDETEVKCLQLADWPPPRGLRTQGSVALVGDAMHPMVMYRGEGANHAIIDVHDFVELVLPILLPGPSSSTGIQNPALTLREALNQYEDRVIARTRPAVLASRQACLDAHEWSRIDEKSPLLTKRDMWVKFDEESMMLRVS